MGVSGGNRQQSRFLQSGSRQVPGIQKNSRHRSWAGVYFGVTTPAEAALDRAPQRPPYSTRTSFLFTVDPVNNIAVKTQAEVYSGGPLPSVTLSADQIQ